MNDGRDAGFMDAGAGPLRLGAVTPDDLLILSALAQDAIFTLQDTGWDRAAGQFSLLINRLRREERTDIPERARALLVVQHVQAVASRGLDMADKSAPLVILSLTHDEDADRGDVITLDLAGGGALRLVVSALELVLRDVTRPYAAPSGKMPDHS